MVVLGGITLIALALRLPSFGDSLFGDELSTHFIVHGFGAGGMLDLIRSNSEVSPPLFFLAAWLAKGLGGFEALRLPSLIAGVASIPVIYLLGLRTVGQASATVAAVLLALSPMQIFYATEARSYALVMLLGMLAALALLRATESDRPGWWAAFALSAAAAVYSHYSAIFLMIAIFIWAFFARPDSRRSLLLASAGAAVLFLPWLPEYLRDARAPNADKLIAEHNPLSFESVRSDLAHWAVGPPISPLKELPGRPAAALIAVGLLLGGVGLLRSRGLRGLWPPTSGVALVLALAAAAPAGGLIYPLLNDGASVFAPRYLIVSWPGLALVLGGLVAAGGGALRAAAVAALIAGFAVGAVKMLDADQQRPDFLGAAEFIEQRGEPGSPVVELAQPTPGPTTGMETALAGMGNSVPAGRSVLPLGYASFSDRIEARRVDGPGGVGGVDVLEALPIPSPESLAARAVREADGGPIFLVTGDASLEYLKAMEAAPVDDFLAALPPGYREVESSRFPGLWIFPLRVHVLERAGNRAEPFPPA